MKSIWKTKKKFEIQLAGQNLFLIVFDSEEDLETVTEGQPWLFRKNLVLFDRLTTSMQRSQIRLNSSLYWIKIGPCLLEFNKKDLMHVIRATFGGILRSEINGEFCRLRFQFDVLKPLRRVFSSQQKTNSTPVEKNKIKDDHLFSLELKAEVNFIGKESLKFSALSKKMQTQCSYTGDIEKISKLNFQEKGNSATAQRSQDSAQLTGNKKAMMIMDEAIKFSSKVVLPTKIDRQLLDGKPTGHNENHLLERPWIREFTGNKKALVFAEAT
ncbi:hypothetical protein PVK06_019183 [Gossypium arboreum]|uniref:DUF4283 domain-containing protein n=1 Tax=Gossypium arboreum TaxID=29729 RepID=A0ABR0PJC7_GOSAR|nr:hypothetical protein PVK06_019183 [Gossypium arboreum]